MSKIEIRLCSLLLKEFFGEIVGKVGADLLTCGSKALRLIARDCAISLKEGKGALTILLQHNMADFELRDRGFIEYWALKDNIILLLRYPRYIYCTKTLYGDIAELLLEEILNNGQLSMSSAIQRVYTRLQEATGQAGTVSAESVKEKFTNLAQTHFVVRCPLIIPPSESNKQEVVQFEKSEKLLYEIPEIKMHLITMKKDPSDEPPAKRLKVEESTLQPDREIYWRANFARFHQYLRDQAIINAVTMRINTKAGELVQTILRLSVTKTNPLSPTTGDVSRTEILNEVKKETDINEKELDSYLAILTDDEVKIVAKSDERGGGMFMVNAHNAMKYLAEATAVSTVRDRFGSKCCRIFRLLLKKHYLEQKQIEELAMIPAKDAKEMTYRMLQENFIAVQEISRTPDHAPSRTFFLFHVRLNLLCRMLLEWSYKAATNAIIRGESETKEYKRVLDKKQRVDAIISTLQQSDTDPSQIQEIEEMISPPERAQLEKVKHIMNKLEHCQLQLDETIFALKSWIETTTP